LHHEFKVEKNHVPWLGRGKALRGFLEKATLEELERHVGDVSVVPKLG
jgi:hypothetical protein